MSIMMLRGCNIRAARARQARAAHVLVRQLGDDHRCARALPAPRGIPARACALTRPLAGRPARVPARRAPRDRRRRSSALPAAAAGAGGPAARAAAAGCAPFQPCSPPSAARLLGALPQAAQLRRAPARAARRRQAHARAPPRQRASIFQPSSAGPQARRRWRTTRSSSTSARCSARLTRRLLSTCRAPAASALSARRRPAAAARARPPPPRPPWRRAAAGHPRRRRPPRRRPRTSGTRAAPRRGASSRSALSMRRAAPAAACASGARLCARRARCGRAPGPREPLLGALARREAGAPRHRAAPGVAPAGCRAAAHPLEAPLSRQGLPDAPLSPPGTRSTDQHRAAPLTARRSPYFSRIERSGAPLGPETRAGRVGACTGARGSRARGAQARRASAWFPCVDTPGAAATYALAVGVAAGEVAAAPGRLLRQTHGAAGGRTFHFRVDAPAPPCHLALAVGAAPHAAPPHPPPPGSSPCAGRAPGCSVQVQGWGTRRQHLGSTWSGSALRVASGPTRALPSASCQQRG